MTRTPNRIALPLIAALTLVVASVSTASAENWPRFRGPQGDGHSSEKSLPVKWDASKVVWRAELPGGGHSSPVVWGDKVFVTSADAEGAQRLVICLDLRTGKPVWKQAIKFAGEAAKLHKMNSWATATCATDGDHVVAFFGEGGLHCLSAGGELIWSKNLGTFPGAWGTAASPVIHGDLVIQNCDAIGESYVVAFNKRTGEQVWKTDRRAKPRGGWSTPVFIDVDGKTQMLLNGEFGVQAYDPSNGEKLWFCGSFNGRGSPAPVFGHGVAIVVNGKPGDLYAVKPTGKGNVTKSHMAWHAPRGGGRDLPSPILVGNFVFTVNMSGIARCNDAKTGKELYKERLGGAHAAAPIAANGLIYQVAESGDTYVVKPGAKLDVVAENKLGVRGEIFRGSPAASSGLILLRSDKAVYAIGTGRAAE